MRFIYIPIWLFYVESAIGKSVEFTLFTFQFGDFTSITVMSIDELTVGFTFQFGDFTSDKIFEKRSVEKTFTFQFGDFTSI